MRDVYESCSTLHHTQPSQPLLQVPVMPSNILHHNPQGKEGSPAATSFRDGQKIQPQTQSQVLTFKAESSSWNKHKDGAAEKKRRIQIQICVLEIADGCLGVGLGLPVNHTAHLRSGNFRLTSTSKGASKGV